LVQAIKYEQYMRYLSLWFGGIRALTPEELKHQYGRSQSSRIGSPSAASNVNTPVELWGQHGDWASFKIKKTNVKKYVKYILSVSSTVMTLPSNNITNNIEFPSDIRV
jgi:hypothetical protein